MGLSFLFPGYSENIDDFRLVIQSSVVSKIWCIRIGKSEDLNLEEKNEIFLNLKKVKTPSLIFTSNDNYLGELFLKGNWKHLAIYLGTKKQIEKTFGKNSEIYKRLYPYYKHNNEILIIDSSSEGVTIRNISNLLKPQLREISVFELKMNDIKLRDFVLSSFTYLGKKYDYDILTNNKSSLYCSELIYYSFQDIGYNILADDVFINRKYISPSSILKFIDNNNLAINVYNYLLPKSPKHQKLEYVNNPTSD